MKFGPVDLDDALGKILGHNIAKPDGRRAIRKGKHLTKKDVAVLKELGRTNVYVAVLDPDDLGEDAAAQRVAQAVVGEGLLLSRPRLGRVNLIAKDRGVIKVDTNRLCKINMHEGITLATLPNHAVVQKDEIAATAKVIPFAVAEAILNKIESITASTAPVLQLKPLFRQNVSLILSGSPFARERVLNTFKPPIQERLENLAASVQSIDYVSLEDESGERELAQIIEERGTQGCDLIILGGETAIMDRHDITPRAVERAGGEVVSFGAPVDPGNLLMLAYYQNIPVLGVPGCARSKKTNVIDWVLPPLLAGYRLSRLDIVSLGHGGLLEDTRKRPMPRTDFEG